MPSLLSVDLNFNIPPLRCELEIENPQGFALKDRIKLKITNCFQSADLMPLSY